MAFPVVHAVPALVRACPSSSLGVALGHGEGAAGTEYRAIIFTNRGNVSCTLRGYPGVSSVGGDDGHQIGRPASRQPAGTIKTITLVPGGVASASYGQAEALNYPKAKCRPVSSRGLRVYPPNLTLARFLPWTHLACSSTAINGSFIHPTVRGSTGT
jgi:hypothetical protein